MHPDTAMPAPPAGPLPENRQQSRALTATGTSGTVTVTGITRFLPAEAGGDDGGHAGTRCCIAHGRRHHEPREPCRTQSLISGNASESPRTTAGGGENMKDRRANDRAMTAEQAVRMLAGTLILLSLALGWWLDLRFLLLTALVGVNLLQSAFTGFCPAERLFRRRGLL